MASGTANVKIKRIYVVRIDGRNANRREPRRDGPVATRKQGGPGDHAWINLVISIIPRRACARSLPLLSHPSVANLKASLQSHTRAPQICDTQEIQKDKDEAVEIKDSECTR